MTRLITTGFEMGDKIPFSGEEFGDMEEIYVNTGDYSYQISYPFNWAFMNFSVTSEVYFKEWMYIAATAWSPYGFHPITFRYGDHTVAQIGFNNIGQWAAMTPSDTIVDLSPIYCTLAQDHWYCIEVRVLAGDEYTGRIVLKVDGDTVIDYSGAVLSSDSDALMDNLYWSQAGSDRIMYIDDIALNDTNGGDDNSWCGGGRIMKIIPYADGDVNDWENSDGDSVNNWSYVDEYPTDEDTSYVTAEASDTGLTDQYNMTNDYDGTDRLVTRVWAECRARKTSPIVMTLNVGFDTGVSVNVDPVDILYVNYTARCKSAEYLVNPDDSLPWEEADIDALQFVAEVG